MSGETKDLEEYDFSETQQKIKIRANTFIVLTQWLIFSKCLLLLYIY